MDDWKDTRRLVLARDGYKCVSCSTRVKSRDADVHHLLPRSMGGSDEPSNLVTLCDGCHAAHHPNLAGGLARRAIERWAMRLARWLDRDASSLESDMNFGPVLRLFGTSHFRGGQLPIVLAALSGKSILVVSPTGSGKSLCFQIPALLRRGCTIVVSPLKTLMSDQVSGLLRRKIPATFVNSALSVEEKEIRYDMVGVNAVKFLYLAPERFFVKSKSERTLLSDSEPEFLVVDEAHCVDAWGRDFRPEYGRLAEVRKSLGSPPVLAFTATAGQAMQQRILASLGIEDAEVFVRGVDRPNIALVRWMAARSARHHEIAALLRLPVFAGRKAMIFVPTAKVGHELQADLRNNGLEIPFYHSRLGNEWERQELLKRFQGESRPIVNHIICTNAFGMGLDVPDVRLVIHWQQPASVEDYLQEFGRAGRDGKQSVAVTFTEGGRGHRQDVGLLRFIAEKTANGSSLDASAARSMLQQRYSQIEDLTDLLASRECFRQGIVEYFEGPKVKPRLTLGMKILNWAFSKESAPKRFRYCCDACAAVDRRLENLPQHVASVFVNR
ncbi:ATP-dependent DNA helicase, RecQ family [Rhizobium leguminosarum bv. trifolii WSM2297]|uniref:DNA 3'-5' helicase n=1 Tax=Rhizobium leguminosarum bv. trifolii WSM2297 TaxID=754762 RepID=J0W4Y1_RHILT|nr:RecQ family ATP-dependent DNA helicase [Rhizobium leguminosarum]EJC80198.1 ATP-dependent DNA helicase, RecQ family [Rhizobium leguminosarum bv. trifolii WSM2297]